MKKLKFVIYLCSYCGFIFGGALEAMKRGLPYESIRPALSKNVRHVFETPLEQLVKEFEP